jgi:hypothetical protein
MATKTIEITCTLEWAKLFESNRDNGKYDTETDGATTIDALVDEATSRQIEESGIRKTGKPEAGGIRYKFKRPWKDQFGRDWAAGPPKVFGPDGSEWPDGELIGNGSIGVVFVDVYDSKLLTTYTLRGQAVCLRASNRRTTQDLFLRQPHLNRQQRHPQIPLLSKVQETFRFRD